MIRQFVPEPAVLESKEQIEAAYLPPADRHLRLNFVASLDGAVEVAGRSGPLGGPADRAVFMAMRAVSDVVMVGAGTARAENYGPVRLTDDVQGRRQARGQAARPPLAVVSGRADLDVSARMFEPDREIIIFTTEPAVRERADLAEVAELVPAGTGTVDLGSVVAELQRRGMGRIVCEGGPALARSLFVGGLVDELCLSFSGVLAGAGHHGLSDSWSGEIRRLELTALMEGDGLLITRYSVVTR
jgi:riboflavin biosynthesis pyrimidine reductase